jgi:hypothetical protein
MKIKAEKMERKELRKNSSQLNLFWDEWKK